MQLIMLIPLVMMIFSDYRSRTVISWQLMLFGIIVLIISLLENGVRMTYTNMTINMLLSLFIGLCVYMYFLMKYKTVQSLIGEGDILFILFLTPFFTPRAFLVFMVISFVVTLLMWIIASSARKSMSNTVPLISGVGICLSVLLIYQQLIPFI